MKLRNLFEDQKKHVCGIESAPSGVDLPRWYRRHADVCEACDEAYDDYLESGFARSPEPSGDEPGDVEARSAPSVSGSPGIGEILRAIRDMSASRWSRRGSSEERFGKRIRRRPMCRAGHSCPDPWNPLPHPTTQRKWDKRVFDTGTGELNPGFEEYYREKSACPVCSGREEGCSNRVSTEFGRPKEYCKEHIEQGSSYVRDLMGKVERGEVPDPRADFKETEERWRKFRSSQLRVGDRVYRGFGPSRKKGEIVRIDPEGTPMDPSRTHVVQWEGKPTASYEDPGKLDLLGPHLEK